MSFETASKDEPAAISDGLGPVATLISRQAAIQTASQSRWREQLTQQSDMQISRQEELSESRADFSSRDADSPGAASASALPGRLNGGSPVARSGYAQSGYAQSGYAQSGHAPSTNSGGRGKEFGTSSMAGRACSSMKQSDETTRIQSNSLERTYLARPAVAEHDPDTGDRKDLKSKVGPSSDEETRGLTAIKQVGSGFENLTLAGVSQAAPGGYESLPTRIKAARIEAARIEPIRGAGQTVGAIGNKQITASDAARPSGSSAIAGAGGSFASGSRVLDENQLAVSTALHTSGLLVRPGSPVFYSPSNIPDLTPFPAHPSSHSSSSGSKSGTPSTAVTATPASIHSGLTGSDSKAAGATGAGALPQTALTESKIADPASAFGFLKSSSALSDASFVAPDAPAIDRNRGAAREMSVPTGTASKDEISQNGKTQVTSETAAGSDPKLSFEPVDGPHLGRSLTGQILVSANSPSSAPGLVGRLPTSAASTSLVPLEDAAGARQAGARQAGATQSETTSGIGSDWGSAGTAVSARLPIADGSPPVNHLAGNEFTPARNQGGGRERASSAAEGVSSLGEATVSKSRTNLGTIEGTIDGSGTDQLTGKYGSGTGQAAQMTGSNRQVAADQRPTVAFGARQDLTAAASETGRNPSAAILENSRAKEPTGSGNPSAGSQPGAGQVNGQSAQSVDSKAAGSGSSKVKSATASGQGVLSLPAHAASANMHGLTDDTVTRAASGGNSSSVNANSVTGGSAKFGAVQTASANPFEAMDVEGSAGHSMTPAGRRELAVGYQDASLGYVELHAHLESSGVHASFIAQSPNAGATLEGHLSSLSGWLNDRHTPVERLTVLAGATLPVGDKEGSGGHRSNGGTDSSAESETRQNDLRKQDSRQSENTEVAIRMTAGSGGSPYVASLGSGVSSSGRSGPGSSGSGLSGSGLSGSGLSGSGLSKTEAAWENGATVSLNGVDSRAAGRSLAAVQTSARAAIAEGNSAEPSRISVVA